MLNRISLTGWLCGVYLTGIVAGCQPAMTTAPAAGPDVASTPELAQNGPQTAASDPADPQAAAEPDTPYSLEDGFTELSLPDFEAFEAVNDTWTLFDSEIVSTGKPKGYLYSRKTYHDFTWRLEYRFDRPPNLKDETKFKGNTGFLVYVSGEHKLWPVCLEVQGKHVQMAAIKENGGASPVTVQDDDAARQSARLPVGRWNRLEIVSREGALTVKLNDTLISRSDPNFLSEGSLGIQAEDHPFRVRRMRIRED